MSKVNGHSLINEAVQLRETVPRIIIRYGYIHVEGGKRDV